MNNPGYLSSTYYGGAIVPPGAVQAMGDDFSRNPIGTGPWIFKEWTSGDHITMTRNDQYRNFHSYVDNKKGSLSGGAVDPVHSRAGDPDPRL